ncbi:S1 family peptidase [Pseudonocardia sp. GCM10023141]|uniref:S1 family peptidase n=1 Tax=Pseudonocardia sp. GCM10023141 TaxID=3252653 RepID=UPI00360D776A
MGGMTVGRDFDPLDFIDVSDGQFHELPINVLQSAIFPVVVMRESTITLVGTAFNVSPTGLFVSAKHVVEEAIRICQSEPNSWIALIWIKSGAGYEDVPDLLGGQLPVNQFYVNDNHDVAILHPRQLLEGGQPVTFPIVGLDTRVPPIGTAVLGLGYTRMTIQSHENSDALRKVTTDQAFHASHGFVTQVFPGGRDRVMIPFPAFESDARFDPGMSGGPVFAGDSTYVCGVVCSGLSSDDEAAGWTSFASMALNALVLNVTVDQSTDTSATLFELAKQGFVQMDENFDRLSLVEDGDAPYLSFPGPQ